jgi:hypothetical protein
MRKIMLLNAKGGCGKSTLATNLASYFATQGRSVVIADFDPQQSSLAWLAARPKDHPVIGGVEAWHGLLDVPRTTDYLIMDAPAAVHGPELTGLVRRAHTIIIPVLPSPTDMRAATRFAVELLKLRRITGKKARIAAVANRVRENTLLQSIAERVFGGFGYTTDMTDLNNTLARFLRRFRAPFIATLRDSVNYPLADQKALASSNSSTAALPTISPSGNRCLTGSTASAACRSLTSKMVPAAAFYFAPDYFAARERFLALAEEHAQEVASHPIDARGPGGEILSIDTAYVGPATPAKLVIVSSGTHGIEGFAGSALQQLWLKEFAPRVSPKEAGVLLVHAINPYGFAHLRRANENNVDLNRNALERFPGPANPAYVEIDGWLNPALPPRGIDAFYLQGAWYILRKGFAAVKQAIAGGQYEFPRGIFYGGRAPEQSIQIFDSILRTPAFVQSTRVLHLDLHTGLGLPGTYKFLVDFATQSEEFKQLQRWFGADTVQTNLPENTIAYRASGLLSKMTARLCHGARTYPAVLEFGTYPLGRMVRTLCRENRQHFYGEPESSMERNLKRQLLEIFCPRDRSWREGLIGNGRRIFARLGDSWLRADSAEGAPRPAA